MINYIVYIVNFFFIIFISCKDVFHNIQSISVNLDIKTLFMDYFSLFKLPTRYQLDIKELASLFKEMQRRYHPDKFVNSTREEQLLSIQKSAIINQAWQTLRNPIKRAKYLLFLHGLDLSKEHHIIYDENFLIEQLLLRERLDNIKKEKDVAKLKIFIQSLEESWNIFHQKMIEQLNKKQWNIAADTLCKLCFFDKLRSNAEKIEEDLIS